MTGIKYQFQFGGDETETDDLALKILKGEKVATSSLYDYYLLGSKEMSRVGDLAAVLDGSGKEICMVRINRIEVINFCDITEQFACEEGDGSLNNWKKIHIPYYSGQLTRINKELTQDTKLVCEWFTVVDN